MRGRGLLALAGLLLGTVPGGAQEPVRARIDRSAIEAGLEARPDSWILVFARDAGGEAARRLLRERGVGSVRSGRLEPRIVLVDGLDEERIERLLDLPGLEAVYPDALLRLQLEESVEQVRGDALALGAAGLSDADGAGVRACVVDSGIRASHEAFGGRVDTAAGRNTADGGFNTSDVDGHGSHVASILAGNWPDGRRGIAPAATLVPVRACRADRTCPVSAVIAGIEHCADPQGGNADLINLSLGGSSFFSACDFDPLAMAANAAVAAGLVVVAASGNDGNANAIDTPACGSSVLSVGAVHDGRFLTSCGTPFSEIDSRACFSNAGSQLDLCAPGALITAAGRGSDTQLQVLQGTSMATPHVAGLVALVLQRAPTLTPAQVGQLLRDKAVDLGAPGRDPEYGDGRIDVVATLAAIAPCTDCPDPGWGDLHQGDGEQSLDLADWLVLRRLIISAATPSIEQLARGDLSPALTPCSPAEPPSSSCPSGDSRLDLSDLAELRRVLAGAQRFSCAPCASSEDEPVGAELRLPGDVAPEAGGDARLDVADVLRLLRFAVHLEDPDPEELLRGDVSPSLSESGLRVVVGDGGIDVNDVLLSLRATVALERLAWPSRELRVGAQFSGGIAAARFELSGWPASALPDGEGAGCGLGGGLDAAGEAWSLTCAWDPLERFSGPNLVRPRYRAPEPVSPESLLLAGEGIDLSLAPVPFQSLSVAN